MRIFHSDSFISFNICLAPSVKAGLTSEMAFFLFAYYHFNVSWKIIFTQVADDAFRDFAVPKFFIYSRKRGVDFTCITCFRRLRVFQIWNSHLTLTWMNNDWFICHTKAWLCISKAFSFLENWWKWYISNRLWLVKLFKNVMSFQLLEIVFPLIFEKASSLWLLNQYFQFFHYPFMVAHRNLFELKIGVPWVIGINGPEIVIQNFLLPYLHDCPSDISVS